MGLTVKYKADPKWEQMVATAASTSPQVRSACTRKAGAVAGAAAAALNSAPVYSPSDRISREDTLASIGFKPATEFPRRRRYRGSVIAVALAIVDSPAAKRWEYGSGHRIPATRFMRKALAANAGSGWRSRGGR